TNVCALGSAARDVNLADNSEIARTTAALLVYVDDATVVEGNSGNTNAVFNLRLSTAWTNSVTVYYGTSPDTADYNDFSYASGSVTFVPGVTNQAIQVRVHGDLVQEPDEQFFLNVSYTVNGFSQSARGIGHILNDDTPPSLSISDTSVVEGNSGTTQAQFTITLSAPSPNWVSFSYATSDGTARASSGDYYQTSGSAQIPPGGTSMAIFITVVGDTISEADETFFVTLTSTTAPVARAVGTCVILNDEPPLPPQVTLAGMTLVGESFTPTNGVIDPGETVTALLALQNIGGGSPSITAMLVSTGGVPALSGPQTYGPLSSGAAPVERPFTCTATGACGTTWNAVFLLQQSGTNFALLTNTVVIGRLVTVLAQNFDASTMFPAGWTNGVGPGFQWMINGISSDSAPYAAYMLDPPFATDRALLSPTFIPGTASARLSFQQRCALGTNSGGVLEIAIGNGSFTDILAAGGSFLSGGYDRLMGSGTALAGRMAWGGNTAGFVPTVVNLPASAAGQSVRLGWRFAATGQNAMSGWYVDTLSVTEAVCSAPQPRIVSAMNVGRQFRFAFETTAGRTYWVDTVDSLTSTNWQPTQSVAGSGTLKWVTNAIPASGQRFYRLRMP
ncbi:MAG: choice-of-anchor J domain-containing protein, partial [Verrucomicrobia bacterium]|nr:choice-of-anchor J domain-containing protein [Verrucomicrobiota bacterium]